MYYIAKLLRHFFVGGGQEFSFKKTISERFILPPLKKIDLYIHIPFCKTMCPYCPYNRIRYEKKMLPRYFAALSKEIDLYAQKLGKINIGSIYIGGGTPTNAIDDLAIIIKKIKSVFTVSQDIAIETTTADINEENLKKMKMMGITMLSVGVQSFNNTYLKLLGRNYSAEDIAPAFDLIKKYNFSNVNVDLIFAFPRQKKEELLHDMTMAHTLSADQITAYPLFTFPYSTVGNYMHMKKIKMPNIFVRKKFYSLLYTFFKKKHYTLASVWSFQRGLKECSYSSVTRNTYIGFGAGAASRLENSFYFNTFSVHDYEDRLLNDGVLPIAVDMPISSELSDVYWFYWKLYKTRFSFSEFKKRSSWKLKLVLNIFFVLGFCKKNRDYVQLTKAGSFWIHVMQNYFMLDYINKVWNRMKDDPFPDEIKI